jgi:hypothetical protein
MTACNSIPLNNGTIISFNKFTHFYLVHGFHLTMCRKWHRNSTGQNMGESTQVLSDPDLGRHRNIDCCLFLSSFSLPMHYEPQIPEKQTGQTMFPELHSYPVSELGPAYHTAPTQMAQKRQLNLQEPNSLFLRTPKPEMHCSKDKRRARTRPKGGLPRASPSSAGAVSPCHRTGRNPESCAPGPSSAGNGPVP